MPSDFPRPLTQLSGGQRTRALLARLLLSNPDLLVLDEPTNHLDIAAVEWLEGYLSAWPGTALIVSHDRYFLDRVVTGIWEMSRSGLESYPGNYTAYLHLPPVALGAPPAPLRRRERAPAQRGRLRQAQHLRSAHPAGQRQAAPPLPPGRSHRIPRRRSRAQPELGRRQRPGRYLRPSSWASRKSSAASAASSPPPAAPPSSRSPSKPAGAPATSSCAPSTWSSATPASPSSRPMTSSCVAWRCVAVIGPNGAGKTTFLKTILGLHPPLSGELVLGAALDIGYFAQAHEELQPERTLRRGDRLRRPPPAPRRSPRLPGPLPLHRR